MFCIRSISRHYFITNIVTECTNTNRKFLNNWQTKFVPVGNWLLRDQLKMSSGTFKFSDYDCIGFDLDNTLARYKVGNMIEMEYDIVSKYLIQKKGFSEKHLSKPLDHNFIMKGLIIDNDNGTS